MKRIVNVLSNLLCKVNGETFENDMKKFKEQSSVVRLVFVNVTVQQVVDVLVAAVDNSIPVGCMQIDDVSACKLGMQNAINEWRLFCVRSTGYKYIEDNKVNEIEAACYASEYIGFGTVSLDKANSEIQKYA